ncbi:MAG: choice-of-anchor D domain-containing protein [Pseudomonadota bacterium]
MTGIARARIAAASTLLALTMYASTPARADVFVYSGEIVFCLGTCDSFAALGAAAGGSMNTTNSLVSGQLDIPVQPDGSFNFGEAPPPGPVGSFCSFVPSVPDIDFEFSISNAGAPACPRPGVTSCSATEANPLVLSPAIATVFGSGVVGSDGNLESGSVTFTFQEAPFCNNNGQVTIDVDTGEGEGVILGAVTFTRLVPAGAFQGFAPAPPTLDVSMPVPDPFPATPVGETSTADITVTNTGIGDAIIALGTSTLTSPFSIQSDTCSTATLLADGGVCTITAAFTPTAEGDDLTGTFTVDAVGNVPPSIPVVLVGDGIVPEIDADPNPLDFGTVRIGQTGTEDVVVSNSGDAPLVIGASAVSIDAGDFSIATDGCGGTSVASGGTCTISVTFAPTQGGERTGELTIVSNDLNEPTFTVDLTGQGATPEITVAPNPVAFPNQLTGQSVTRAVTVTNSGGDDLIIGQIDSGELAAPLALTSDGCSTVTLVPAATCVVEVTFDPQTEGDFTDSFDIPSNDPNQATVTVAVEGSATLAPQSFISLDPAQTLSFGDIIVSQDTMSLVTVSNDGSADLTVSAAATGGANAADFSATSDCQTLMPGESCAIMVSFAPSDVGVRTGTLTVSSDASNDTEISLGLTGTGISGPQLTLSPESASFGSVEAPIELDQSSTSVVMGISSGSLPVAITGVALSGDGAQEFAVTDDECTGEVLDPMEVCTVEVTFSPVTAGDKTASLDVASNDVDMPSQSVSLTGFVLAGSRPEFPAPMIEIGESSAPVFVGESSTSEFDVTNTGTDDLMFVSIVLGGADADQFELTEDCTSAPVTRNNSCDIDVTFSPTSPGAKTAELTIVTDSVMTGTARNTTEMTTVIPIMAVAAQPAEPPPEPGSQLNQPPAFATGDTGSNGACFIATAAYGSYLDPNVQVLRDFRDEVLMRSDSGRWLVRLYYHHSPLVADHIAHHDGARFVTRIALTPVVYALAYPVPALMMLTALWYAVRRRRAVARDTS